MPKFIDKALYNAGFIKEKDYIYRSLSPERKKKMENSVEILSDPTVLYKEIDALREEILSLKQTLSIGGTTGSPSSISGYVPAGSVLRKRYPSPWALHAFIAENYHAAVKARRHNIAEFYRDGYVLIADESASKKTIKKVDAYLKDLDIARLRTEMFDYLKVYGNFWVLPTKNKLGGITKLDMLLPERIDAVYEFDTLLGWKYWWNNKNHFFPVDSIDHVKTYSLRNKDMGVPILAPVVIDIEADMHASIWSNTIWQKGGLIKAIIALETLGEEGVINENVFISFAKKLQEIFARQFAGIQGAGQLLFTPAVKGVHNIVNAKDLEGAYDITGDKTAIKVAGLLGCPPEVLGISRKSQYENKAATMDFASMSVDNDNYYIADLVDKYITKNIIEAAGFKGISIRMSGEFGAVSNSAAEFLANVANSGCDIITVNEGRTKVLHWEPLEGPEGDQFVGHYKNEALLAKKNAPAGSSKEMTQKEKVELLVGPMEPKTKLIKHKPDQIPYY